MALIYGIGLFLIAVVIVGSAIMAWVGAWFWLGDQLGSDWVGPVGIFSPFLIILTLIGGLIFSAAFR